MPTHLYEGDVEEAGVAVDELEGEDLEDQRVLKLRVRPDFENSNVSKYRKLSIFKF
jgi:hypothetical protein